MGKTPGTDREGKGHTSVACRHEGRKSSGPSKVQLFVSVKALLANSPPFHRKKEISLERKRAAEEKRSMEQLKATVRSSALKS